MLGLLPKIPLPYLFHVNGLMFNGPSLYLATLLVVLVFMLLLKKKNLDFVLKEKWRLNFGSKPLLNSNIVSKKERCLMMTIVEMMRMRRKKVMMTRIVDVPRKLTLNNISGLLELRNPLRTTMNEK